MQKKRLLLLDCNYLCRRALFTTGELQFDGARTGVLFGFFRELIHLHEEFPDSRSVFCFDSEGSVRKELFPGYKASRSKRRAHMTGDQLGEEKQFYRQVGHLRDVHLLNMGFNNVFFQPKYEADDLIATIAQTYPGEVLIVSADRDMFQLISKRISVWNPQKHKMYTITKFKQEFGIAPRQWITVKAIAGCSTDDIPGVRGVGEITALKYLRGELPKTASTYYAIRRGMDSIVHDNKLLIRLPFPGTRTCRLSDDDLTEVKWNKVVSELALDSLRNIVPGQPRRLFRK